MANKILIHLQSVISYFLEPPTNRRVAVGAIEGLWQGLLIAVVQVSGDSSVLNLCAKDQAIENCEHRSGI